MKYIILAAFLVAGCSSMKGKKEKQNEEIKPQVAFEITEGILHPESLIYSPKHESFFATNVATGNPLEKKARVSYLSKISKDGKTIKAKWITGLYAPKGLTVVGDDLYFTDVTRIVKVNIPKGKITKIYPVSKAGFLNDTTVDAQGNVYISDMFSDVIYKISKNKLSVWVKDAKVAGSNGLFTDGKEHIIAVKWGTDIDPKTFMAKNIGDVAIISLKKPTEITVVKELQGHLDGIDMDSKGTLWISDWISGDVYTMTKQGITKKMFNLGQGTADISVARDLNLLLVPQMGQNRLIFIQL
jgi:sugar lactone lactonase YvrE